MKVIKRDGTIVEYNAEKIRTAIKKANNEVSKKQKATDEEIDEMIAEDTLIEMKCTACGHIDNVPDWIIGEFAEEDRMYGKHGEVEIECPVCNGPMRRVR